MNFIDFHVDTLYRLFYRAKGEVGDLWKNNCHIDLEREIASGYTAQLFACFLDLAEKPKLGSSYEDVLGMISRYRQTRKKLDLRETTHSTRKIRNRESCLHS